MRSQTEVHLKTPVKRLEDYDFGQCEKPLASHCSRPDQSYGPMRYDGPWSPQDLEIRLAVDYALKSPLALIAELIRGSASSNSSGRRISTKLAVNVT
jgi:hypothetical protein